MNIAEIEMQLSDLVNEPFDQSEFVFKFIEIFNPPKATLTKLRKAKPVANNELLWPRKLLYQVAKPGQAANVVDVLKEQKMPKNKAPRFIIATDGNEFSALDTKADEPLHCDFTKLNDHFDFFLPLAGIDKYKAVDENPADIKAAGRLAKFHDEIIRHNRDWHTPEKRHALNQFMTRILFCLFSEDTGSFKKDLFIKTITEFGGDDGEQLQLLLKHIFETMNLPEDQRKGIPAHIRAFPFVNGGLFADQTEVPVFSKRAKRILIDAARLDWSEINPDIFGSMIQAVVDDDLRGDLGLHYTSVPNIMKVSQPLFLMSLEEDFNNAHGHREELSLLRKLLTRISKIRVFDPACGSGNFLIIAYRELRSLEMRIFQREEKLKGDMLSIFQSSVKLSNFYGIELADFAAETAKLSLWIAEYQMNQRFKRIFGEAPPDFPLKEGGHIMHGNALRLDWLEVCPPSDDEVVETYIVGNPPYAGFNMQTDSQTLDLKHVYSNLDNLKYFDYISGWFIKAARYISDGGQFAFVTTNSICQGLQVPILWPQIFALNLEIFFAHKGFSWSNNAKNNAGVICSIIGIRKIVEGKKYLFHSSSRFEVKNINAYLVNGGNVIVKKRQTPLSRLPKISTGNIPYDGGNLILSPKEKILLVENHPNASKFIRPLTGSREFINGLTRFCIWIEDNALNEALKIEPIAIRIELVRKSREKAGKIARNYAHCPHLFYMTNQCVEHQIIIPRVSSVRRKYIPMGLLSKEFVISDSAQAIYDPPIWVFAIVNSYLHNSWVDSVGGRLKNDYRYSAIICYNTFPVPKLTNEQKQSLENHAWDIIAAREAHPGKTIAWLYDPKTMPDNLLAAHKALDDTLEKIYIGRPFKDDTERLEHLFKLYAEMTAKENKEVA